MPVSWKAMYFNNAITPVKVTSAQRLSDEQKDKIKEKMSSKVGQRGRRKHCVERCICLNMLLIAFCY